MDEIICDMCGEEEVAEADWACANCGAPLCASCSQESECFDCGDPVCDGCAEYDEEGDRFCSYCY